MLERLGVAGIIDEVIGSRRADAAASVGTYLALACANRVVAPCSKLAFSDWWADNRRRSVGAPSSWSARPPPLLGCDGRHQRPSSSRDRGPAERRDGGSLRPRLHRARARHDELRHLHRLGATIVLRSPSEATPNRSAPISASSGSGSSSRPTAASRSSVMPMPATGPMSPSSPMSSPSFRLATAPPLARATSSPWSMTPARTPPPTRCSSREPHSTSSARSVRATTSNCLAFPPRRYSVVDEEAFPGLTAFEARTSALGAERRVVVTHSAELHDKQLRGFAQTLAKVLRRLSVLASVLERGRTRRARSAVEAEIVQTCSPRWVARCVRTRLYRKLALRPPPRVLDRRGRSPRS